MGNVKGNRYWEARMPHTMRRPPSGSPNPELSSFIRDKYCERRYAPTDVSEPPTIDNYQTHPYGLGGQAPQEPQHPHAQSQHPHGHHPHRAVAGVQGSGHMAASKSAPALTPTPAPQVDLLGFDSPPPAQNGSNGIAHASGIPSPGHAASKSVAALPVGAHDLLSGFDALIINSTAAPAPPPAAPAAPTHSLSAGASALSATAPVRAASNGGGGFDPFDLLAAGPLASTLPASQFGGSGRVQGVGSVGLQSSIVSSASGGVGGTRVSNDWTDFHGPAVTAVPAAPQPAMPAPQPPKQQPQALLDLI